MRCIFFQRAQQITTHCVALFKRSVLLLVPHISLHSVSLNSFLTLAGIWANAHSENEKKSPQQTIHLQFGTTFSEISNYLHQSLH